MCRIKIPQQDFAPKCRGGVFVGHYSIPPNTMTFVLICMNCAAHVAMADGNKRQMAANMTFLYLGTVYDDRN